MLSYYWEVLRSFAKPFQTTHKAFSAVLTVVSAVLAVLVIAPAESHLQSHKQAYAFGTLFLAALIAFERANYSAVARRDARLAKVAQQTADGYSEIVASLHECLLLLEPLSVFGKENCQAFLTTYQTFKTNLECRVYDVLTPIERARIENLPTRIDREDEYSIAMSVGDEWNTLDPLRDMLVEFAQSRSAAEHTTNNPAPPSRLKFYSTVFKQVPSAVLSLISKWQLFPVVVVSSMFVSLMVNQPSPWLYPLAASMAVISCAFLIANYLEVNVRDCQTTALLETAENRSSTVTAFLGRVIALLKGSWTDTRYDKTWDRRYAALIGDFESDLKPTLEPHEWLQVQYVRLSARPDDGKNTIWGLTQDWQRLTTLRMILTDFANLRRKAWVEANRIDSSNTAGT